MGPSADQKQGQHYTDSGVLWELQHLQDVAVRVFEGRNPAAPALLLRRADELDARNQAISSQEEVLQRAADPLAVSDDRSYEILRLLDPVLGDSVRVLRRLGIGGSFDDLVDRARCELSAGEREKKSRGRWNLFG